MTKSLTHSSCFGFFQLSNILNKHDEVSIPGSVAICRQKVLKLMDPLGQAILSHWAPQKQ